jgi:hypothetical protein
MDCFRFWVSQNPNILLPPERDFHGFWEKPNNPMSLPQIPVEPSLNFIPAGPMPVFSA